MGFRAFPGAADGLRGPPRGDESGDRARHGAAEMAPEPAGAQGGRAALASVGQRGGLDRLGRRGSHRLAGVGGV
jgi:hypothetical protein